MSQQELPLFMTILELKLFKMFNIFLKLSIKKSNILKY